EEIVGGLHGMAVAEIGGDERDRLRRRRRRVVDAHYRAELARLVRPDLDDLLIAVTLTADDLEPRPRRPGKRHGKTAMVGMLVEDPERVGVADAAVGDAH